MHEPFNTNQRSEKTEKSPQSSPLLVDQDSSHSSASSHHSWHESGGGGGVVGVILVSVGGRGSGAERIDVEKNRRVED